ncbi:uncharacterized protein KD926_004687 [Aspergillus affinis]|uniref:uncharacterized protein n=1 Tax=Aspergillus affinis TaxID=1070780 RepID=UPI0022FF3F29|nr:uncharacterized protein KD926_004687 [Aspergillus affinis]KAI9035048.1 hypothetical protein KD926_004687 [Aspergillus affinis]
MKSIVMATTTWFCENCMKAFKAFMKDMFSVRAIDPTKSRVLHDARSIISEQVLTGIVPCMLNCLDLEGWEYDRLCAELEDLDAKSFIHQCFDIQNERCERHEFNSSACHLDPPQLLANLCQLIDTSGMNPDEGELHRRDLKSPPTDDPTSKEPTRTRAPPKITSASPTRKILTLTELTDVPSTLSTTDSPPTTANSLIPTTFITSSSSSTSIDSDLNSTSASTTPSPSGTTPVSLNLSTGSIVGIAIGAALLCGVLWLGIRCCFKHGQKLDAAKDDLHSERLIPLEFATVPEKYGNTISEIDSRVTANPPRPVREDVYELGGEPVVAPRPDEETPKIVATVAEGIKHKEQTETVAVNEVGGGGLGTIPEAVEEVRRDQTVEACNRIK